MKLIISNDLVWRCCPVFLKSNTYIRIQRDALERQKADKYVERLLSTSVVASGPIQGMRYSRSQSYGSALIPKLIGSYESELHEFMEKLLANSYATFVDIGFAEGYYLVGLARRLHGAKKIGFDISDDAHALCKENIRINNMTLVEFELHKVWTYQGHKDLVKSPGLVVVDCEGFEFEIFKLLNQDDLIKCDWIVETHDFLVSGVHEIVKESLAETHHITEVSVNLSNKDKYLPESLLDDLSTKEVARLVSEGRPISQKWIIAVRKL